MKIKLLLAALFVAGLASALAFAAPTRAGDGTTTGATTTGATTTTGEHHGKGDHPKPDKPKCQNVELRGSGSGSFALTVTRAHGHDSTLVGKQVTLTVPTGSTVGAEACVDAAGVYTLRNLEVQRAKPPTTTTGTTTTTATTTTTHA